MAVEEKREDAAAYVILDSALNGKGVSAQTNPMEKPEDEAKAVFDELSKDIIIPAFNRFVLFMAAQLGTSRFPPRCRPPLTKSRTGRSEPGARRFTRC